MKYHKPVQARRVSLANCSSLKSNGIGLESLMCRDKGVGSRIAVKMTPDPFVSDRSTQFEKHHDSLAFEKVIEETLRTCRMQIYVFCLMLLPFQDHLPRGFHRRRASDLRGGRCGRLPVLGGRPAGGAPTLRRKRLRRRCRRCAFGPGQRLRAAGRRRRRGRTLVRDVIDQVRFRPQRTGVGDRYRRDCRRRCGRLRSAAAGKPWPTHATHLFCSADRSLML